MGKMLGLMRSLVVALSSLDGRSAGTACGLALKTCMALSFALAAKHCILTCTPEPSSAIV